MPWKSEDEGKVYKYQYHPHGDKSQPLRNAPSAMNTVIVPNVTLPEVYTRPSPIAMRLNQLSGGRWPILYVDMANRSVSFL